MGDTPTEHTATPEELLRAWLRNRDAPCPICGYNLRALRGARCPECGVTVSLGLSSPEFLHGWWLASLIGWSCAGGFSFFITVFIVIVEFVQPGGGGYFTIVEFAVLGTGFAVPAAAVVAVTRRKAKWAKWAESRQKSASVLNILMALATAGAMIAYLLGV